MFARTGHRPIPAHFLVWLLTCVVLAGHRPVAAAATQAGQATMTPAWAVAAGLTLLATAAILLLRRRSSRG